MNKALFEILFKWIKEAGYQIDYNQFEISLISHPDYNSLTSITDTLNEYDIENTAATIPFEAIGNLTEPYIAYIKQGYQEQFALIIPTNNNAVKIYLSKNAVSDLSIAEFEKLWTGTIVAIEKLIPKKGLFQNKKWAVSFLWILFCSKIEKNNFKLL